MGSKVFSSAVNFTAVTKSDSTLVTCDGIYVGGTGDVALAQSATGTAVTFVGVPAGSFLPIRLRDGRIMSTNTTATGIVSLNW